MLPHDRKVMFETLENYKLADQDDSGAYPYYYGFVNKDSEYYLMRMASVTGAGIATRFYKGTTTVAYSDAWAARTDASYDLFYNAF